MNTSLSTRRSFHQGAFTLIELLVVITIIAVLAGLLLPVTQKVLENSRKVSAKNTELQIVSAVNSYQTEYGQYPVYVASGATPMDTTFGVTDNKTLFNVLRALNANDTDTKTLNSRQIVYFESKNVKNAGSPRDGFVVTTPATGNKGVTLNVGDLVDPWGNLYYVRVDSGYTNAVKNPYVDSSVDPVANDDPTTSSDPTSAAYKQILRTGVISWSWGNDGVLGPKPSGFVAPYTPTPGDDVCSWQ